MANGMGEQDRRGADPAGPAQDEPAGAETGGRTAAPTYGRGYGRDLGGGGRDQGFEGSHGEGYGASLEPNDYRAGFGGPGFGAGGGAESRTWTGGPRGEDISSDHDGWNPGRDAQDALHGPNAGLGPTGWRRTDAQLRDKVCEHLMEDRILDAREIEVRVDEGVVTLCGQVRHASDVKLAEMLTREAAGTAEVRNRLHGPDSG